MDILKIDRDFIRNLGESAGRPLVNEALDAGEAHFQSPAGHGRLGRQNVVSPSAFDIRETS